VQLPLPVEPARPARPAPQTRRRRPDRRWWWSDSSLQLSLAALALLLRWPNYQTVPGFSDETRELLLGLAIAQGKALPLTNAASYMGALWNYLVAAAFWLSGFNLQAPRTLILLFGVATVPATYWLGRAWSGGQRLGGALAGLLLAGSTAHIAINSHVAWSNCTTPLFTTLGIWALWKAVSGSGEQGAGCRVQGAGDTRAVPRLLHPAPCILLPGTWLLLAGLCWGLAFQTHPGVLGLAPGAALFLVWRAWPLVRSRWLWLAAGLFVLVNLNLLVYNLASGFESIRSGVDKSASYTDSEEIAPRSYQGRLAALGLGLYQVVGGGIDLRDSELDYLLDPGLWPAGLLALAGLGWQWRRGNPLPALLLVSTVLLLPVFNAKYRPLLNGRYLAPLLPMLFASGASLLLASFTRGVRWPRPGVGPLLAGFGLALLTLFLALHPLLYLQTFYAQAARVGRTNVRLFQLLDQVKSSRPADEAVLIDQSLDRVRLGWGSGWVGSGLRFGLAVAGVPADAVDPADPALLGPAARCRDLLLVLNLADPVQVQQTVARLDLRGLDHRPASPPVQPGGYRLLRLDRLPAGPPECRNG
jgi:4-amino-4-deoxy-L-arabinose transferase-like glycosyltransferase